MEKNIEQFMEALEASTKYEEGAADLIHKAGTAIKNFFGTSTGAAQRAAQDAQRNAQTQATQQKADEINAQNMSSVDLATKINQVITGALKIANKGLNNAAKNEPVTNENATESSEQKTEQNNDSKPVKSTNENPGENNDGNAVDNQQKTKESLTSFLSALYEADASKNQEYYQTAIKNLQDIQNLVKPFLQGQKEFDKKTLKTISDKINDQSIQGVLAKNDKKALKAIQGINTAINGKIKVLQNNKQQLQQTQSNSGDNTQQTQGTNTSTDAATTNNSQQQSTEQTQNNSQEQAQNTTADNQQSQNADTQAKDPAQMQPEEIKQQPEGQQVSKEYKELDNAISNLMKYYDKSKSIRTLVNAWKTFKSMNSNSSADEILQ